MKKNVLLLLLYILVVVGPLVATSNEKESQNLEKEKMEAISKLHDPLVITGDTDDEIDVAFQDVLIKGKVLNVNTASGNIVVLGEVKGDIHSGLGNVVNFGTVSGDINLGTGSLTNYGKVGPTNLGVGTLKNYGTVSGNIKSSGLNKNFHFEWQPDFNKKSSKWSWLGVTWIEVVLLFFPCLFLLLFMEKRVLESSLFLDQKPGELLLLGGVAWVMSYFVFAMTLLLSLILVGVPFLIIISLLWAIVCLYGYTVCHYWLGKKILTKLNCSSGPVFSYFVGSVIHFLIGFIPFVGFTFFIVFSILNWGVCLLTFRSKKEL